jgi:hypothetical protein
MKNIRKQPLFPQLPRLVLAVGIGTFLLISIILLFSLSVPDCDNASFACIHHSATVKTEQSGFEEQVSPQMVADNISCPGSTGWTGASCTSGAPTPPYIDDPECMPWPICLSWNFP